MVCILFAGAIILIAVPRCHRFRMRGRGFLGFKEMYPVSWFEKMLQTYFSFFFLGGLRSSLKFLGLFFFVGRTHGCTHHVTTPRQLGETLKAHFVVSPFGMWQKEDKMKKESTQIMDCSTFFSLFLNIFSVVVEHIFYFHPYLEKIPTSQKVMSCSTCFFAVFESAMSAFGADELG